MPPIYLIDSSIYIFKAWFSMPDTLTDVNGQPVNAFYGFFDFVIRFLKQARPQHIVFLFDESLERSHRNDIYPAYKANRDPTPPELKRQFDLCRKLVRSLGISEFSHNHYEADDLIGTLAVRSRNDGAQVIIITSDKDLTQLIRKEDLWWDFSKSRRLGSHGISKRFGVMPEKIADLLAITGDAVDNIPGVPGIGPLTASRLLRHFDSLESLLARWQEIEKLDLRGAKRIAQLIGEHLETIRLSRRLTEICCEVSLPENFRLSIRPPDERLFSSLAKDIGFSNYRHRQFNECVASLGENASRDRLPANDQDR